MVSHCRTLIMCIEWCLVVRVLASLNRSSNEQGVSHCSDAEWSAGSLPGATLASVNSAVVASTTGIDRRDYEFGFHCAS